MRVIATNTLIEYWESYPKCEQVLKSWLYEIKLAEWDSLQELENHFLNASILPDKRAIFNINENKFRLIVDIEFRLKIVFVVWFGTHKAYNLIDAKTIKYVKTNKE